MGTKTPGVPNSLVMSIIEIYLSDMTYFGTTVWVYSLVSVKNIKYHWQQIGKL